MTAAGTVNKIRFHYLLPIPWFKRRTVLRAFLSSIFRSEKKKLAGLSVIFCSDDYLLQINQQYLRHNSYTDIITFDLSTGPSRAVTGEIYISVERVVENAAIFGCSLQAELHRVLFHGALHLCGYGDKTPTEKTVMRSREDHYLNLFRRYVSRETGST